jgi:hypothetical protein
MGALIITNNTDSNVVITDLRSFEVVASGTETLSDYFNVVEICNSDNLIAFIADETFTVNNGTEDLTPAKGAKYCLGNFSDVNLIDEYRDRSGKIRFHQTSRKLGTRIMWTGVGDDPTDPHSVGGGGSFTFNHTTSGIATLSKYIDFNCVNNETWLHEGYITWNNAHFDTLTLEMVPRVTTYTAGSNTYYNLYGGYMVIPAAGDGTIDVTSDITTHSGGLVYMPDSDLGEPPTAFWNADWNTSTKEYENITAAPYGNGRYNMFTVEICLARFVNGIPFLANGFIALNSSDTDQFGHGMRLKMIFDIDESHDGTNGGTPDNWNVGIACIMCLHREKSN